VLYFILASLSFIGLTDKAIEVALIALLIADAFTGSSELSG
jgi:hypothetical protein